MVLKTLRNSRIKIVWGLKWKHKGKRKIQGYGGNSRIKIVWGLKWEHKGRRKIQGCGNGFYKPGTITDHCICAVDIHNYGSN